MKVIKIIIFTLTMLSFSEIYAQQSVKDTIANKSDSLAIVKDTLCYKLNFNPGDTLYYHVMSYDSITIEGDKPLLKNRFERIRIVCDSVVDNKFYLSQVLIQFLSYESKGAIKKVERKNTPWINRKVWFVIDSLGNRYKAGYQDTMTAALAPGGAFQPFLIFPFQKHCKQKGKTWMAESLDELVENGMPTPLIKQSSLFRAVGQIDTLDEHCNRMEYIKTGQGSYKLLSKKDTIRISSIVTGFGVLDISREKFIPVHYLATSEIKLTISVGNKEPQTGTHNIFTRFTLEQYISAQKKSEE